MLTAICDIVPPLLSLQALPAVLDTPERPGVSDISRSNVREEAPDFAH